MAKKRSTPEPDSFLRTALARWQTANTAETELRTLGERDQAFLNLDQWDADALARRGSSWPPRPSLTIDQIGEPYRQLVGSMRSAKPGIQVNPVDNGADPDTAEVLQGLIRHIELTGGAKAAREEAFKSAVGMGWGYYRLVSEYEQDTAGAPPEALFDQVIRYQAIENPFLVFRDPACPLHEPWKCRFAYVIEDMPKDEFLHRYGEERITTASDAFSSTGISEPDWFPEGFVRVADYYYVEDVPIVGMEVALLEDGSVVRLTDVPKSATVLQRRRPTRRVVYQAKISGAEVLEGEEGTDRPTTGRVWAGRFIPIVPMYGEALTVKGKRHLRGIVRAAIDPQRMYNYQNSELVYELALAPKSKVLMAEGQMEGYERQWAEAATTAYPALMWKPTSLSGQLLPPPQIAQFTDPAKIQALVVAINQHKADLRSTTGWYDATDPSRMNTDQSGRAILARKEAQNEGAINYKDNFAAALIFEARLLVDLIPKVYTRIGRVLRIVGLEDETEVDQVVVGQERKMARGVKGIFEWGVGRYDVTVSIGASYSSRRQEASEWGLELMKVLEAPQRAAIAPIVVRNMDAPGNREAADRLDRTLPPEIRETPDAMDPEQAARRLQQAEAQMAEMGQVIQGLQEAIKSEQAKYEAQAALAERENAVKLQIAQGKTDADEREAAMALLMKQATQEAVDAVKQQELEVKRLELELTDAQHQQDIASAERIAALNAQTKLDTAAQAKRRMKITKTLTRNDAGLATGTTEVHEDAEETVP